MPGSGPDGGVIVEGGGLGGAAADAAAMKHVRGVVFLFCNCLCMAVFLTVQEPLLQRFPSPTLVTVWSYVFGADPQTLSRLLTAQTTILHTLPCGRISSCLIQCFLLASAGVAALIIGVALGAGGGRGGLIEGLRGMTPETVQAVVYAGMIASGLNYVVMARGCSIFAINSPELSRRQHDQEHSQTVDRSPAAEPAVDVCTAGVGEPARRAGDGRALPAAAAAGVEHFREHCAWGSRFRRERRRGSAHPQRCEAKRTSGTPLASALLRVLSAAPDDISGRCVVPTGLYSVMWGRAAARRVEGRMEEKRECVSLQGISWYCMIA